MGELIFVGLGLAGTKHLTLEGMEAIRSADRVVAEFYTSRLVGTSREELENVLGRTVEVLDRAAVEQGAQRLLDSARNRRVAFLTAGDPMTATTHQELRTNAQELGVATRIVHGVSIQTAAAGAAGLQSYKFGRTTTLVFPEASYNPASPYDAVRENRQRGLHTLVLLDIRADEDRFMSASEGARVLLGLEASQKANVLTPETDLVACARVGSPSERILYGPAQMVEHADLGPPLHCLIVPGKLHFAEERVLERFRPNPALFGAKTQRA